LRRREDDVAVQAFKDFRDGNAHLRIELIGQAGDKERDLVSHSRQDYAAGAQKQVAGLT